MRTVLVTGTGGAGRTTVAAATALAFARGGGRTLLLSADPLGELLGTEPGTLGPDAGPVAGGGTAPDTASGAGHGPTEVAPGLWAARIDSGEHFRSELLALQERAATLLDLLGARKLTDEELTELPGSDRSALLQALYRAIGGGWDALVVDLPPLDDALPLLALPEQLRRYLRRLLPRERQAARALRPMMAQLAGVPMPAQWLYETAARRDAELAAVQALIEDRATTVRLVAEPGPAAARALRTARTGLALYGLRVDTLVANRTLPPDATGPWLATLAAQQRKCLEEWYEEWGPGTAVREAGHLGRDPEGRDDLVRLDLGESAGDGPGAVPGAGTGPAPAVTPGLADPPWRTEDRLAEDNLLLWCLPLPGAVKSELSLVRRDDELLLTVGRFRRIVPLTSALRRCTVTGAALTDGELRVRFAPDPALWPRPH
ncbi:MULTISPECIES: ArsA-related P-loop ATPase [unclassified Streptomyces]|uniref:ArsA family ATPase n=1 Tax=unclassified Streptomyces TaxID=2593676 RepID=UPI0004C798B4|nr:ArsA-related P-loop ATPase [Streptomyces sp. NRRL F-5135]